ncbi:unnamed protein product [Rotaria sordida]|uniref:Uncharacterized protein n=1 Tax=Rotaria sordida TaxID=392033 RepID=A0A814ZX03_9BILA|nr:unnamed protein product [Rotaria sordida]
MYKIIQELLHFGLIRPSDSPYAAPAMLVAKHDGTWRMVVDYKKLNNITIKDNYPLPNIEQVIQLLSGRYNSFSNLDMKSGFCQILIKEEDKFKTAFITPNGLFEWNVLAQGLKNSPPSFQRVMTDILSTCRQFSLVYIDDIAVYSHLFEEHLNHLTKVLPALFKHNFQLNPVKCSIFHQQIDYLSHTISEHGVKPTNEQVQAMIKLRQPTKLPEANKFLGALPHKFEWGASQSQAFSQLKQLLITSPLFLDFPDDNYPIILTTDESEIGIGGRHNCLADYLSRHPIQNNEEIFDEDYSISMLFQGKPPETVHAPVNHPPVIGAIVTRSKMKQIQQQQNENDKITPPTVNDIPSSSSKDKIKHSNKSSSHLITSNNFDITQIKLEHRTKKPDRLNPIPTPKGPFQLICIDYCGPFKPTPRGNQYVLYITDYFTRWMTAIVLPDCSAQTTAQTLFNNYICQYGVPLAILSDQGTHFKNQLMESIAKLIGYNHIFSSVYHPQSNEMIERFKAIFVPQIVKLQDLGNNNYDEFLSPVVFVYNIGIHATTKYSPFQLQFGREPRLPTNEPSSSITFNKPNDYYVQLKKNLLIIQQHARDNIIRR